MVCLRMLSHDMCLILVRQPRNKIESLVKKGGHPDPDCPDDPESVRFWCTTGSKYQDKERTSVSMQAEGAVKTSADSVGHMLGHGGVLGDGLTGAGAGSGPSLAALVGVMGATPGGQGDGGAPKAKAKAKAKAKVSVKKEAKTPEEMRTAARVLFQHSIAFFELLCEPGFCSFIILGSHVFKFDLQIFKIKTMQEISASGKCKLALRLAWTFPKTTLSAPSLRSQSRSLRHFWMSDLM